MSQIKGAEVFKENAIGFFLPIELPNIDDVTIL